MLTISHSIAMHRPVAWPTWLCCIRLTVQRVLLRHTEDMDLHSLNYLHHGAPQVWYCVPPSEKGKMDAFIATKLPTQYGLCREFLRHKVSQ